LLPHTLLIMTHCRRRKKPGVRRRLSPPLNLEGSSADTLRASETASKYGGSPDLSFSGITTFARTPHARCLDEPNSLADIVILGMPFDVRPKFPMNAP
jgi:hypothetical protein